MCVKLCVKAAVYADKHPVYNMAGYRTPVNNYLFIFITRVFHSRSAACHLNQ